MKRDRETSQDSDCESRAGEPASKHRRIDDDGPRARQDATTRRQKIQDGNANPPRSSSKSQKGTEGGSGDRQTVRSDNNISEAVTGEGCNEVVESENTSERLDVFTVGENSAGQLGLGENVEEVQTPNRPVTFQARNISIKAVIAGGMHTLCLASNGEIYAFGDNSGGALGTVTVLIDDMATVPQNIGFRHTVRKVSSGDNHAAAITTDGELYAWGSFRNSNPGANDVFIGLAMTDGSIIEQSNCPVRICIDDEIIDVCSGLDHVVCLTKSREVYTFGSAVGGRLGRIPENFYKIKPHIGIEMWLKPGRVHFSPKCTSEVTAKPLITRIWATNYSTFCKMQETTGREIIYTWGENSFNHLGLLDTEDRPFPCRSLEFEIALIKRTADQSRNQPLAGELKWVEIAGGTGHTLALDNEGTVYGMGRRDDGQLGDGEIDNAYPNPTLKPIEALLQERIASISAFDDGSMAITTTGKLYSWGSNQTNQLGLSDEVLYLPRRVLGALIDRKVRQASVGGNHSVILAGPARSLEQSSSEQQKPTKQNINFNNTQLVK